MSVCTLFLRAIRTVVRSHLSQVSAPAIARAHTGEWFWTCHAKRAFAYLQRQFSRLSHAHHQQHHQQATYRLTGHPRPVEIPPCLSFRHWSASNVPSPILRQQLHGATSHYLSGSNPASFYDIYQMRLWLEGMHHPGIHDGREIDRMGAKIRA